MVSLRLSLISLLFCDSHIPRIIYFISYEVINYLDKNQRRDLQYLFYTVL